MSGLRIGFSISFAAFLVSGLIPVVEAQHTPEPPALRDRGEVQLVLAKVPEITHDGLRDINIVLLADEKDHGLYEHDYPKWQMRWQLLLGGTKSGSDATQINMFGPSIEDEEQSSGAQNVKVTTAWDWPSKEQLQSADLIVAFNALPWDEEKVGELRTYLARGGGFVVVHTSCVVPQGVDLADEVAELIGLNWNWDYTIWRHGPLNLDVSNRLHPITLGLPERIYFLDEAYWPLHGDRSKVTSIGTSNDSVHVINLHDEDGNLVFGDEIETIQQEWPKEPTRAEPIFWTYEYGKGRVYGCILGHYDWTFDDPYMRILLLRWMSWAAGESPYRFDPLVLRGAAVK